MTTPQAAAALFGAAAVLAISLAALQKEGAPGTLRGLLASRPARVLAKVILWIALIIVCLSGLIAYAFLTTCGPNAC